MILTITLNSALDKVFLLDEFTPSSTHRVEQTIACVGGKGLDSSVTLCCLGADTVGLVFVAGNPGKELIELVRNYGIIAEPVWTEGETRIAHVISETRIGRHSHVISGKLTVNDSHLDEFMQIYHQYLPEAAWVICAGSVPPSLPNSVYRQITGDAVKKGIPVLIDSSQEPILDAISAHPTIIKMNWNEFQSTFSVQAATFEHLIKHASQVFDTYNLNSLVITCSAEGILAFCEEGAYHTIVPKLKPVNDAGSGDAVSAALAWRFSQGDNWEEVLKWSGAVSTAVVLTERTAECRMEDVQALLSEVYVRSL